MRRDSLAFFALLALWPMAAYEGCTPRKLPPMLNLCELMDHWKDYHGKQVRVRAIYRLGAEQSWLYDPSCRNAPWSAGVEFREDAKGPLKKLDQLARKDRRTGAWVVLEGVFYGPEPYGKAAANLPEPLRERLEKAPRRYGHLGSMDSMIEVTKVVEATKVPADAP